MNKLQRCLLLGAVVPLLMLISSSCSSRLLGLELGEIKVDPALEGQAADTRRLVQRVSTMVEEKKVVTPAQEQLVERLIDEIAKIQKDGVLSEAELRSLDHLLAIGEKGFSITTDDDLLDAIREIGDEVKGAPESASQEVADLLEVLDVVGTDLSTKVAVRVNEMRSEIAADVSRLQGNVPPTIGCSIDVAESKIRQSVQGAAGDFWSVILHAIGIGTDLEKVVTIPRVCLIEPGKVVVTLVDGAKTFAEASDILTVHGFNFDRRLPPQVTIESSSGVSIPLSPVFNTDYIWEVDLQNVDLSAIGAGARIAIDWQPTVQISEPTVQLQFNKTLDFEIPPQPKPDFSADKVYGAVPLRVQFFEESSGGTPDMTFAWDFGDGGTASLPRPMYEYKTPGAYTVTLTVDNEFYPPQHIIKHSYVTVDKPAKPVASFTASATQGEAAYDVDFAERTSEGVTTRLWDFGDGQTSSNQSPSHRYEQAGTYTVSLIVWDAYGQASDPYVLPQRIVVVPAPYKFFAPMRLEQDTTLGSLDRGLILPESIVTNGYSLVIRASYIRSESGTVNIVGFTGSSLRTPDRQPSAADGDAGGYKQPGQPGRSGRTGQNGASGKPAGDVDIKAGTIDSNISIRVVGQDGGDGGGGGNGGDGGRGGKGRNAEAETKFGVPNCKHGAGDGMTGGAAGNGGRGGAGGSGGDGGDVKIHYTTLAGTITINTSGGAGGSGGDGGSPGMAGGGGAGGDDDPPICNGDGNPGSAGSTGASGAHGPAGEMGGVGKITLKVGSGEWQDPDPRRTGATTIRP